MELVAGRRARGAHPARADPARRGAAHRASDRRGARGRARQGHHPPRPQAREHQAGRASTRRRALKVLDFGLAKALEGDRDRRAHRPRRARRRSAWRRRRRGCHRHRRLHEPGAGAAARRPTAVPTSGRSAWSSSRCWPAAAPSPARPSSHTLADVLERDPDWSLLPPTTPPAIKSLLERCLDKNPRQRLQAIGDARHGARGDAGTSSARSRRSRRRRPWYPRLRRPQRRRRRRPGLARARAVGRRGARDRGGSRSSPSAARRGARAGSRAAAAAAWRSRIGSAILDLGLGSSVALTPDAHAAGLRRGHTTSQQLYVAPARPPRRPEAR